MEGLFCIFSETGITEANEFSSIKNSGHGELSPISSIEELACSLKVSIRLLIEFLFCYRSFQLVAQFS